jgi:cold shock CspA family protein
VYSGKITSLIIEKKYGFIASKDGNTIFFHQSSLPAGEVFSTLSLGQEVRFVVQKADASGRVAATNIVLVSDEKVREVTTYRGVVRRYGVNGQCFGYIISDDGSQYFFHKDNICADVPLHKISNGIHVEFSLGRNAKGVVADNVRHDSGLHRGQIRSYGVDGQTFGFVSADDGKEYFFHRSNLAAEVEPEALFKGLRVEFVLGSNAKGAVADRLEPESPRINDPAPLDEYVRLEKVLYGELEFLPTERREGIIRIPEFGTVPVSRHDFITINPVLYRGGVIKFRLKREKKSFRAIVAELA